MPSANTSSIHTSESLSLRSSSTDIATDNMPSFNSLKTDLETSRKLPNIASPLSAPPISPSIVRVNQTAHEDGPEHQYQINQTLLYEHEFHGHAYASAHLQRLQNGVYASDFLHSKVPMHVTFVAVTFTLHPTMSSAHRFTNAVVEITANDITEDDKNGKPLRFIKYAPHLAYGRISSESLKWSFQLGAALGVTQGPVNLSVNPTGTYEKEKVLGTMMKIQGSTRSTPNRDSGRYKRISDTKLVWSLEENDQQETGLPREFTFVFLVERPNKGRRTINRKPSSFLEKNGHNSKSDTTPSNLYAVKEPVTESARHHDADQAGHVDHEATFGPFSLGITIRPHISNAMNNIPFQEEHQDQRLDEEVGQRLLVEHTSNSGKNSKGKTDSFSQYEGYFNFATMKQDFEGLIELPGNAVTTKEPSLPGPA